MALHPNELDQQIENLRTLQQSYNQIAGAAEAYNTGKVQLAQNITAKGIAAEPTETLPELAAKVTEIQQTTTVIDGGDMYAAQLTGDGALWNLYDILAQMKSQWMGAGQYAALIVCEYYKGYDSLQLQGADAYYTCDGAFYDYDALHVWTDAENGKANRWVCFLYQQEGARLDITNTAISPRSMYIGGHIGTIEYFVNGRLTDLVCGVEETDVVDNFLQKGFAQEWGFNLTIKGVKKIGQDGVKDLLTNSGGSVVISGVEDFNGSTTTGQESLIATSAAYVCIKSISGGEIVGGVYVGVDTNQVILDGFKKISNKAVAINAAGGSPASKLFVLSMKDAEYVDDNSFYAFYAVCSNLIDIVVGELKSNLSLRGFNASNNAYWNPTNVLADADKKAQLIDNIKNHILARVSDATGGTQLVFTVSTNMYNAIASENITWNDQTMTLADAFLTKNWLLAGA